MVQKMVLVSTANFLDHDNSTEFLSQSCFDLSMIKGVAC